MCSFEKLSKKISINIRSLTIAARKSVGVSTPPLSGGALSKHLGYSVYLNTQIKRTTTPHDES